LFVVALTLLVIAGTTRHAWAWGRLEHRVISRLAKQRLTPKAKAAIAELLEPGDLKFDPSASDGVGSQIKPLQALGSGTFNKIETGKTESFSLTVDDTVRERIAKGSKLCLAIVPADSTVAATYFGASENAKDKSPKLTLDLP